MKVLIWLFLKAIQFASLAVVMTVLLSIKPAFSAQSCQSTNKDELSGLSDVPIYLSPYADQAKVTRMMDEDLQQYTVRVSTG